MTEKDSLTKKIDKLIDTLQDIESKQKKKFKLPFGIRLQKGKALKRHYCIVIIIRVNSSVQIKMLPIEEDTVKIGETFHDASAGNVLRYKKYPLLIIPEWNMKPIAPESDKLETVPFDPSENFKQAEKEGTLTSAEKLIITKMKLEAIRPKMRLNLATVLIILAIIGGGYFLLDYLQVL